MFVSYSLNPGNSTGRSDASRCFFLYIRQQTGKKSIQRGPLLRGDWGLQSSHRYGCGPTKGSKSPILSPLRSESGRAERATEGFRTASSVVPSSGEEGCP